MEQNRSMELLTDGKAAFPALLGQIRAARETVDVNMFIWRNDAIGNAMADALLEAADRGVRVTITKDRYGVICESCEENRRSFFHRTPTVGERVKIAALSLLYNRDPVKKADTAIPDSGEKLEAILRHPNITVRCGENRYDHSKFYLFDSRVLILGGINIEDKEAGCDYAGRVYQDYMVKITDPAAVAQFLAARTGDGLFGMNVKEPHRRFEMRERYLCLIREAERELTVVMAYLSPLPDFEAAFLDAAARGVSVRLLIPARANFQDDLNKKAAVRLMQKSGGAIRVWTFPGMLHTKLLMSEREVTLGSCNITKKAFGQLDELNLFVPNDDSSFARSVREQVEATFARSQEVSREDSRLLRYRRLMAAAESLVM